MFRALLSLPLLLLAAPATAQEAAPGPLTVAGELRSRFEILDGEFRAGGVGGDQLLLFRALLHARYRTGPLTFGIELQDSRIYLGDADTPADATNPADILQAYVEIDGRESLEGPGPVLRLGRQTVEIGSPRQIERRDYDNVVRGYTGAHLEWRGTSGDTLDVAAVVPVDQRPEERERRAANDPVMDAEQWNRPIFALHYRTPDILPDIIPSLAAEGFVYSLLEEDGTATPTPNRRYIWPGFRLHRPAAAGRVDLNIEGAWRFGSRRATTSDADREDLDVSAAMLLARVGYTLRAPWRPHFALQYYYASGDNDPGDRRYGQFERLFGSRRTDLNHTSIYGPLTPANLSAPGIRLEARPSSRFDARLTYSAAFLTSSTDSWVVAGLRDPTGRSGSFLGHAIDARLRRRFGSGRRELEAGASALLFGSFPKRVPNGPAGAGTLLGYLQLAWAF